MIITTATKAINFPYRIPRELVTGDRFKRLSTDAKLLMELDTGKGFGLIERKKQGQSRPAKIFVKRFTPRANIQKITRLTKLEPELQKMVEEKVLPVHTAADISYLKKDEQKKMADAIEKEGGTVPSGSQAAALKKESQSGNLTPEKIEKTVAPTKREVDPPLKVTFSDEELRPYFAGERVTVPEVKRTVFEALNLRKRALARQASKEGKEVKDKKPGLAR